MAGAQQLALKVGNQVIDGRGPDHQDAGRSTR